MKPGGVQQPQGPKTFFDRILDFTSILGMAMILFSMLSLSVHVVSRYVMGIPLNWTIDLACIFVLYLTILTGAWLQRSEGHVVVDFIFQYLNEKPKLKLDIFNSIVCSIAFLFMIWFGIKETITTYRMDLYMDMPIEPPRWVIMVVIPIGFLLLLIQYVRRIRGLLDKLHRVDQ